MYCTYNHVPVVLCCENTLYSWYEHIALKNYALWFLDSMYLVKYGMQTCMHFVVGMATFGS